ncbi:MAG: hypothetical protein ABR961_09435 [Thermoanaerobaculaceae bacterium]|jgi:hypothetical protein
MKITAFCLVVAVAGAVFAAGQEQPAAQAPSPRAFKLDLKPLYQPGYEPARELRLALSDSPMSRLELGISREQWAARNPGPAGNVVPFQTAPLPFRFHFDATDQSLVLGPWSSKWDQLSWQEKVAAGAQTSFIGWALLEMVRHAH